MKEDMVIPVIMLAIVGIVMIFVGIVFGLNAYKHIALYVASVGMIFLGSTLAVGSILIAKGIVNE